MSSYFHDFTAIFCLKLDQTGEHEHWGFMNKSFDKRFREKMCNQFVKVLLLTASCLLFLQPHLAGQAMECRFLAFCFTYIYWFATNKKSDVFLSLIQHKHFEANPIIINSWSFFSMTLLDLQSQRTIPPCNNTLKMPFVDLVVVWK